jgi:positive regulator of sigma E activity
LTVGDLGEEPLRERGPVVRLEGPLAVVTIHRAEACGHCAASGACHALSGSPIRELRAVNAAQAAVGDLVEVEVGTGAALRAALLTYLVPTLVLLGAALGAHALVAPRLSETAAGAVGAGAGLGALGLYVLAALLWRRRRGPSLRDYPVVIRRV